MFHRYSLFWYCCQWRLSVLLWIVVAVPLFSCLREWLNEFFLKRVSAYFAPRDAIGDGMCYLFRLLVIFVWVFVWGEWGKGKNNSANSEYSYSLYDYLGDFKCVEWRWRQKDGEGSNIYDSAGGLYSSKLYIGVILIFGILSYLYWNEVNGKDNNENYEKKRFKHMLKSNPWERYLIILCVWGAKTYWKKYLVNQLLLHWLSGVSFPSYFIVVFNIIFNCSVWKMLKRIILWIIILGENYMKIL